MFLLDTNILSQSQKAKPLQGVSAWLRRQTKVAIPFPVLVEIEEGIADVRRTKPDKADQLADWRDALLATEFEYPTINPNIARSLAQMHCCRPLKNFWFRETEAEKVKKPSQDLFIAAIAIEHRLPIATLDGRDFEYIDRFFPIPGVYNPEHDHWHVDEPLTDFDRRPLFGNEVIEVA